VKSGSRTKERDNKEEREGKEISRCNGKGNGPTLEWQMQGLAATNIKPKCRERNQGWTGRYIKLQLGNVNNNKGNRWDKTWRI